MQMRHVAVRVAHARAALQHIDVDVSRTAKVFEQTGKISKSTHRPEIDQAIQTALIAEVETVAQAFGYDSEAS